MRGGRCILGRSSEIALRGEHRLQPDAFLRVGSFDFMLEWRSTASTAVVHHAIEGLKLLADRASQTRLQGEIIPLLAVPFMGESGRKLCATNGCGWLDLSGNAYIRAPGLQVRIEGNPNRYKRPGSTLVEPGPQGIPHRAMAAHASIGRVLPTRTWARQLKWMKAT